MKKSKMILMQNNYHKKKLIQSNDMFFFKKILFVFFLAINTVFAELPSSVKNTNIRVVYIVDTFDDDVIDTEVPRSVLDSILQDVDSVYFAPFGACDCDCAGDDLYFYFSEKQKAPAKFHVAVGMPKICTGFTDNLDLVLRLKSADKINAIADSLMKEYKPNPSKQKRAVNIVPFIK